MSSSSSSRNWRRGARPDQSQAAAPGKRRAPVFRVRGVPPDLDRAILLALLESHNDLSGCGLGIHTLAADIDGRQVATIFFTDDKIPPRLKALERHDALAVEIAVDRALKSHRAGAKSKGDGRRTHTLSVDPLLLGLTTLYTPPKGNHHFDVLAVHGLGGSHPYGSFVSRDGSHMWLKDDLPSVIPSARIIIYGFDTKLPNNDDCAQLDDLGGSLRLAVVRLWQEAKPATPKPLVLIGLSLGGLLIKEALIQLSESKLWSELGTVTGVLLFGTPNDGMRMESFLPIVKYNSNRLLLNTLNSLNSPILKTQNIKFHQLQRRASFELFCFWERRPSPTAKMVPGGSANNYSMVGEPAHCVTKTSATSCLLPGAPEERTIEMNTDHSGLVKYRNEDPNFDNVKPILVHMCGPGRGAAAPDSLPALNDAEKECQAALSFTRRMTPGREINVIVPNTGEWLFAHKEYKRWHSCLGGLLLVKGIAGSGKSTLLRHAIKRIKALPSAGKPPLVLEFFFDRQGYALQKSPVGLFRSLLHQLLTRAPHVLAAFVNDFQRRSAAEKEPSDDTAKWSADDLKAALRSSLAAVLQERPVWLLVDALDEADDEAAAVGVVHEFKALLDGVKVSAGDFPLRIIFTARPHLVRDDECHFKVTVQGNNNADIADWVKQRFSTNQKLKESTIGELITARAGGLFLWASLVVERAHEMWRQGKGLMSIENMVRETQAKLAVVYRQILDDLVGEERALTQKLFQWMCFAERPLTLDEVKWALIVDAKCSYKSLAECESHKEFDSEMATRVVYISRGLVKIEPSSSLSSSPQHVVRFIHQTVPDFLLRKGNLASILHDPTLPTADVSRLAHYQLSRTCIRYLEMEEIAQSTVAARNDLASAFPLLHYATTSWVAHTEQSDQDDLPDFFHWPSEDSEQLVQRWVQIYGKITQSSKDCPPKGISLVHIVARYNLMGALEEMVKRNVLVKDLDVKNYYERTPLLYAAERGHRAVVKKLLEKGASPNVCDRIGWTPLLHAAENGHKAVVEDLLLKKANVNAQDSFGATALHWAIWRRNETMISLLLKNAADTEVTEKGGGTPLAWAIEIGSETTVRELLQGGSAVNYWYKWVGRYSA